MFQRKKKEILLERRLYKVKLQSLYFDIKVNSNDNVTRVTCKICTQYLPQIWVEAREKEVHGTVLMPLLKYAAGLESTHIENIDKHGKAGEQHDSSI